MAILEKNGLLKYKDAAGNITILYPVTTKENVDGMEDIDEHLLDKENPHEVTAEQVGAIALPAEPGTEGQVLMLDEDGVPYWGDAKGGGTLVLHAIRIKTQPTKRNYISGEVFNPAGMVVEADYVMEGSSVIIASGEVSGYSYPSSGVTDGQTKVTVSYTENGITKTADVSITVSHALSSIAVTTNPTKTSYEYGDTLATAGMVVRATYSDGASSAVSGYSCSPTALNTVGTQAITVSYTENGITKTTTFNVTVARKTLSGVPAQSGTLTYDGTAKTPSWDSKYDSAKMTLSVTAQTNAGTYSASFTPKANYRWPDGTTTAKSVNWTIGKAAGSLSISPTSIAFNASTKSANIAVTRAGDGAITAESSNTAVATVRVSGNTVIVSAPGETSGTATITVKVAAGTNHTAPSNKTASVEAAFKATASTTPASGVSYTSGLSGITQAKLSEYAEAISNNSAITRTTSVVYIDDGSVHCKLSTGDKVSITVSSKSYEFQIIGFNHDDLTTVTAYGSATATGKAGITFQSVDCLDTTQKMNSSNTNVGGWKSSVMRSTTLPSIKGTITAAWTGIMKMVNKKASAGNKSTSIDTVSDDLFLLSEIEVFGSTTYSAAGEGEQYAWYSAGNTKVKKVNGSANNWWERSPYASNATGFCSVGNNGNATTNGASYSSGVAFGFCV